MACAGCELVGALFSSLMAVSDFSRVGTGGFLSKFSLFSRVSCGYKGDNLGTKNGMLGSNLIEVFCLISCRSFSSVSLIARSSRLAIAISFNG